MSDDGSLFGGLWPPPARLPARMLRQRPFVLIVNPREAEVLREAFGGELPPSILVSEPCRLPR